MIYIVKWVEMDEIFNYYPCFNLFEQYDDARNFQIQKEEEIEQQQDRLEELFEGKIISEIYLEEIIEFRIISFKDSKTVTANKNESNKQQ